MSDIGKFWEPYLENEELRKQLSEDEEIINDLIESVHNLEITIKQGLDTFINFLYDVKEKIKEQSYIDEYERGYRDGTIASIENVLSNLTDFSKQIH